MSIPFNISLHNNFVQGHGQVVQWYKAYLCACGQGPPNMDANRARLSCTVCNGVGLTYDNPLPVTGLITGIHNMKELLNSGEAYPGDCVFGLAPGQSQFISDWDMVRFPFEEPYNGETRIRGEFGGLSDTLDYTVVRVFRVMRTDPTTNTIIKFVNGVDYTIVGRTITWSANANISTGDVYSISATVNFDWITFVSPMQRYDNTQNLGQRCVLRKRHMVMPAGSP